MTTITVPIDEELNQFIKEMIQEHKAETKAGLVRMALQRLREEELFKEVFLAQKSAITEWTLKGDLDELADAIS